jgi:osmoprotectant transport system permease protein
MSEALRYLKGLVPDILRHTYEHVYLVLIAMAVATFVALPLGIFLSRTRWQRFASGVMTAAGMIQTVPSLALMVFIYVLFKRLLLPTIGPLPGIVALVLYALLPILRNTYTGIRQVDPAIIEVARGMGMRPRQILFLVQIPLSLPVIMAGIRISTVWSIGVATLATLIGAGGLGDLIMQALRTTDMVLLLAGTIPAALLAVLFENLLGWVEKWLTPKGMRTSTPNK